jgi:hypothetical protein
MFTCMMYQKKAKIVSERFKHRWLSAEFVIYWIENILRHNGAPLHHI